MLIDPLVQFGRMTGQSVLLYRQRTNNAVELECWDEHEEQ